MMGRQIVVQILCFVDAAEALAAVAAAVVAVVLGDVAAVVTECEIVSVPEAVAGAAAGDGVGAFVHSNLKKRVSGCCRPFQQRGCLHLASFVCQQSGQPVTFHVVLAGLDPAE